MDLIEFLKDKKCPITKTIIAEKLFSEKKTPATMFHNKLYNVQGRKFNATEIDKLLEILKELGVELSKLTVSKPD